MFYISLHAVLPLLMLQIYRTGIPFIYIVRFVGDRSDEGEVERSVIWNIFDNVFISEYTLDVNKVYTFIYKRNF